MTGPLGVAFAPTTENAQQTTAQPPERLPQAIQILSLRLPRILGAQAPADQALLGQGPQGASPVVSAVVQSVLQSVLGSMPPQRPSAPGAAAAMTPSSPSASRPLSGPTESQGVQQAVQTWQPGKPSINYEAPMTPAAGLPEPPRYPFAPIRRERAGWPRMD